MKKRKSPNAASGETSLTAKKFKAQFESDVFANQRGIVFECAANYTVGWSRMRDEADIISWVYHLSTKEWLTPKRLNRFLELVAEKKKLDLHCAP